MFVTCAVLSNGGVMWLWEHLQLVKVKLLNIISIKSSLKFRESFVVHTKCGSVSQRRLVVNLAMLWREIVTLINMYCSFFVFSALCMVPMQSTHCWLPRPVDVFIPLLLLCFCLRKCVCCLFSTVFLLNCSSVGLIYWRFVCRKTTDRNRNTW